ncbi:glucuronyl hydrolase [Puteibacter caeruleilacunae]|nr:glucuronyl hydrolase [Puteibacter caeruleilacunae]
MKPYNRLQLIILICSIFLIGCNSSNSKIYQKTAKIANIQYGKLIEKEGGNNKMPRTLDRDGTIKTYGIHSWASGFLPGNFWYLYELTQDDFWKDQAIIWTQKLNGIQHNINSHAIGFQTISSFYNANRLLKNDIYTTEIIKAADGLLHRYNNTVGCIKSWNYSRGLERGQEWFYPVVIDNMATLELLFVASKLTGQPKYKDIAIKHARTTMSNHYRDDYSSYHIIDYNAKTGNVLDKATYHGISTHSSWARGQAWGLYGFTLCYRETKDEKFLDFAEHIASFIMNHPNTPEDRVPYWDYNLGKEGFTPTWPYDKNEYNKNYQDAASAAIIASALFELSTLSENSAQYYGYANQLIQTLSSSKYMASKSEDNYFLLKHSVGNFPRHDAIDLPTSYADYYFLEALCRKRKIDKGE